MAISEAVSGKSTRRVSHPATRCHSPSAGSWRKSLVRGRIPKGGNLSVPVDQYFQPLCPLLRDVDEDRYLAVDSSKECFDKFTAAFADPASWHSKGNLVVVTGDRGYGKTSLIQRCAFWLREEAKSHGRVVVVDLSDERWGESTAEADRLNSTFDWIQDGLRDILRDDEVAQITKHAELREAYRDLGRVLSSRVDSQGNPQPVLLIVLLQGYPRAAEVAQYYRLARPGMFFFAELFDKEQTAEVTAMMPDFNRVATDVHHLALNILKSGDANLLVDWIRRNGGGGPEVPEAISDLFNSFITECKMGIRELSKLAWGTLAIAAAEPTQFVTTDHVFKYYLHDRYERNT
jgi:hypothetical protein